MSMPNTRARVGWSLAQLGWLVLSVSLPRSAAACGASSDPFRTLSGSLPEDGAVGVARNGGLSLFAQEWTHPGSTRFVPSSIIVTRLPDTTTTNRPDSAPSAPDAGVHDAGVQGSLLPGEAVEGALLPWWWSSEPTAVWAPAQPFAANATYAVDVEVTNFEPAPTSEANGPTELHFTFSTGTELFAPLAFDGPLRVSVERHDAELIGCSDDCGRDCRVAGTVPALGARIEVPPVRGGSAAGGYQAWLSHTANSPATFSGPGEGRSPGNSDISLFDSRALTAGEASVFEQQIVEEGYAYAPCFALNVWDTGGQSASASICLDVFSPEEELAKILAADEQSPTPMATAAPPATDGPATDAPTTAPIATAAPADVPVSAEADAGSNPLQANEPASETSAEPRGPALRPVDEDDDKGGCSLSASSHPAQGGLFAGLATAAVALSALRRQRRGH